MGKSASVEGCVTRGKPSFKSVWRSPEAGLSSKQPLSDSVQGAAIEIRSSVSMTATCGHSINRQWWLESFG